MDPAIQLTVSIITRDRAPHLANAIKSILPQMDDRDELLVVDNGSSDETPQILAEIAARHPAVRFVRELKPGMSVARNVALAHARGKYIIFIDDDELAEPGWLSAYRQFLKNPPTQKLGCVGGPYIARHEGPTPSWLPADYGSFHVGNQTRKLETGATPAGGNTAYPIALALQFGGFHLDLKRRQDTALNVKLRDAGYEVWWLEEAPVRHIIPGRRMRIKAQCRIWFEDGQDTAVWRLLQCRTPGERWTTFVSRALVTPVQFILQMLVGALQLLVFQRKVACRTWFKAARTLGILDKLLRYGPGYLR